MYISTKPHNKLILRKTIFLKKSFEPYEELENINKDIFNKYRTTGRQLKSKKNKILNKLN